MERRTFLTAAVGTAATGAMGVLLPGSARAAETAPGPSPRLFDVTTTIELAAPEPGMQLWVPLLQSAGYQRLIGTRWESDAAVRIDRDRRFGANMLHARWTDAKGPQRVTLTQRLATWDRLEGDASVAVTAAERAFWTPEPSAIVRATARQIVDRIEAPRARARAIYDWVVATTWRDATVAGCGTGDIDAMLRNKRFGGKCADINSLMVGLCRAAGIPAREVYGIRLAQSAMFKSLGRSGDVTGGQHCRAEIHLDEAGWMPVDPADVRKAVLEEKLPVDSAPIRQLADSLFGTWEGNWGGYNSATGIRLAGAPRSPALPYLMYPCAMSDKSSPNCLDARAFAYTITSSEVVA